MGASSPSLESPILVTGSPRAGKTLVAKVLSLAPEFSWLSEPKEIWDTGMRARGDDRRYADEAAPAVREAIQEACSRFLRESGKPRYVDDLARHALRIPFAHAVMPQAKIILVARDPSGSVPEMMRGWHVRDTVKGAISRRRGQFRITTSPRLAWRFLRNYLSVRAGGRRKSWGPRVPGMHRFDVGAPTAAIAAHQWATLYRTALDDLQALPRSQQLVVRYEELIGATQATVRRIGAFAMVEDIDDLVEKALGFVDPDYNQSQAATPTDADWAIIADHVADVAKRLGYEPRQQYAVDRNSLSGKHRDLEHTRTSATGV